MDRQKKTKSRAEAIGHRAGWAALGVMVGAFTLVCTLEIFDQTLFVKGDPGSLNCRAELGQLLTSLDRARSAATNATSAGRDSLEAFRGGLGPGWALRPALEKACAGDAPALKALGELDRLRYAEEHTVRYEARTLAKRRRQVALLGRELGLEVREAPSAGPDDIAHE